MNTNVALLLIQVGVLLGLAGREFRQRHQNLVLLILIAVSLVLVQGQAAYVLWDLTTNGQPVMYFNSVIFRDGFTLANQCVTGSVFVIAVSYLAGSARKSPRARSQSCALYQGIGSYIWTMATAATAVFAVVHLRGGLGAFMHHAAPDKTGGLTMTLFVLLVGTMPLLHRFAFEWRTRRIDCGLFAVMFLIVMVNSRFLAILALFQLVLLIHHCYRSIRARGLLAGGVIALAVLLGWGSLRDYLDYEQTMTIVRYYFGTPSGGGFDPLGFFYRHNESTFSGLAGILSVYLGRGIEFDFAVSCLQFFTHLTPNAVRTGALDGFDRYLVNLYPYHGSVVPGGYEASFAHFGFAGILLLSIVIGVAPAWLHRRLLDPGADRLKFAIVASNLPLLFMADWAVAFFILGELAALYVYRTAMFATSPAQCTPSIKIGWET